MSSVQPAAADAPESLCERNIRSDLGDKLLALFNDAERIRLAHEEDVDKLEPATAIYVKILENVPHDKTTSAGYAEVLLAYGKCLFAFAKRSIYQSAILGGDVETAALQAQLTTALVKEKLGNSTAAAPSPANGNSAVSAVPIATKKEAPADVPDQKAGGKNAEDGAEPRPAQTNQDALEAKTEAKAEESAGDAKQQVDNAEAKEKSIAQSEEKGTPTNAKSVENNQGGTDGSSAEAVNKDQKMSKPVVETGKTDDKAANGESVDNVGDGDGDEEDDNDALTWEQLEYARSIFEALGDAQRTRLACVYEALGDLQLESDNLKEAADEYAKAVAALEAEEKPSLRLLSNLKHQRYLALRANEPLLAADVLQGAINDFAKFAAESKDAEFDETLKQMRSELEGYRSQLSKLALEKAATASKDADTVTVVQPRRKPPKPTADEEVATVVQPRRRRARKVSELEDEDEEADGGDGTGKPSAKRARIDNVASVEEQAGGKENGAAAEALAGVPSVPATTAGKEDSSKE